MNALYEKQSTEKSLSRDYKKNRVEITYNIWKSRNILYNILIPIMETPFNYLFYALGSKFYKKKW